MNAISHALFDTEPARWAAIRSREPRADGRFIYAVATTGVYCHPSCAARPAKSENVRFYDNPANAEAAGFRACKRCKPDLPPRVERDSALIAQACRTVETEEEPPALEQLAAAAGLSPSHFHRLFRRIVGVTPKAFADAHRTRRVQTALQTGDSVTQAIYDAGFNSSGRFYEAAEGVLGMAPAVYRAGGPGEVIQHAVGQGTLGTVLVAWTDRGVCAILLGDDAASLVADLTMRFPRARLQAADAGCNEWVAQAVALVDAPGTSIALPLDIRGTAFQRRVWEVLRRIPAGTTLSYASVAARLGTPTATRAVAGACAANSLAVAIPCHRVIASDGALSGYRWGIGRKRLLLQREGDG